MSGAQTGSAPGAHASVADLARLSTRVVGAATWTAMLLAVVETGERLSSGPDGAFVDRWARHWARGLLRLVGADLHVLPCLPPPACGPRLVVANHRSALDIPLLLSMFGGSFMSRHDLASWPLLSRGARKLGVVFVDRDSRQSGARAIRGLHRLLKQDRTASAFPEGTTYPGDEVRPFRPGVFAALRGLVVEVVPVGLAYPVGTEFVEPSFSAHAANLARRSRTCIAARIGEPMSVTDSVPDPAECLHTAVQTLVYQARQALDRIQHDARP